MNLEEELRKTWDLWESGVPLYMRGGQLEVDPPDMVSPEATQAQLAQQQLGQKATGTAKENPLSGMGPFDGGAGAMFDGLMQGVRDIAGAVDKTVRAAPGALTEGGLSSVGGTASDDVHLYGAQRLNPVAAGKAQPAPPSIQALWREMTDGQDAQSGALSQALNLINSEGQQYGMLQPGQRFAVRRGEGGQLEPIIADGSMTDSALVAGGRLVTSYYAADPLGGLGGAAAAGAKLASEVDPAAIGAGFGMIDKVARPEKGVFTKMAENLGETKEAFVKRMNIEAPIVTTPEDFARHYGAVPPMTPEAPSAAVAIRTAGPDARGFIPELPTTTVGDQKSAASAFAQIGGYFDSLVRMRNGGAPRAWSNPEHQGQILSEAAAEVKHQLALADPSSATMTKVTGFGWYDEDIARTFNTAGKNMQELRMDAKRGVAIPWGEGVDKVTPSQARILAAAIGAPMSFGNPANRNADIMFQAYEQFRKTGQIPEKGIFLDEAGNVASTGKYWTQRNVSEQYLGVLNTLIREIGPAKTAEWLVTEHSIAELRDLKRRAVNEAGDKIFKGDSSMGISGKADEIKPGAFIFGPKGGQFMGNLLGFPGTTTDMWFTRTWNRYLGTSREGLGPLAETGLVEQPRNLQERQAMADMSRRLTDHLNGDAPLVARLGRPLTERDTQAVLWYFEQQMYKELGVRVTPTSFGEGAKQYGDRAKAQAGTGLQRRAGNGPDGGSSAAAAPAD